MIHARSFELQPDHHFSSGAGESVPAGSWAAKVRGTQLPPQQRQSPILQPQSFVTTGVSALSNGVGEHRLSVEYNDGAVSNGGSLMTEQPVHIHPRQLRLPMTGHSILMGGGIAGHDSHTPTGSGLVNALGSTGINGYDSSLHEQRQHLHLGNGAALGGANIVSGLEYEELKDELLGVFPCVRLKKLSPETTLKDVMEFFSGLGAVLDVVFERRPTLDDGEGLTLAAEAVVLFGTLLDYHGALQRYSLQIRGRYVDVAPATRTEYYSASSSKRSGCLEKVISRSRGASITLSSHSPIHEAQPAAVLDISRPMVHADSSLSLSFHSIEKNTYAAALVTPSPKLVGERSPTEAAAHGGKAINMLSQLTSAEHYPHTPVQTSAVVSTGDSSTSSNTSYSRNTSFSRGESLSPPSQAMLPPPSPPHQPVSVPQSKVPAPITTVSAASSANKSVESSMSSNKPSIRSVATGKDSTSSSKSSASSIPLATIARKSGAGTNTSTSAARQGSTSYRSRSNSTAAASGAHASGSAYGAKNSGGGGGVISEGAKGSVLRMRGLPYRTSRNDVASFFKGSVVPDDGVHFVTRADGRFTGEAYVRFATREDAKLALKKDREMLGNRYIELFTSSPEEMARYKRPV